MIIIAKPITILIVCVDCLFNEVEGCSKILTNPSITKKLQPEMQVYL
jgi:hypothetical protein